VTTGSGNDLVVGDIAAVTRETNGDATYIAHDQETGHDDVINVGEGDNFVLAGLGNDTITSGDGTDHILGDNGELHFVEGQLNRVFTTQEEQGGNDTIEAGNGDNVVIAGAGADTVTTGSGNDLVVGDIASVTLGVGAEEGNDTYIASEQIAAHDDVLNVGEGDNFVLAGLGNDTITSGDGTDHILGDNGELHFVGGALNRVFTTQEEQGGNDTIEAGDGDNVVIAGAGADSVTTGSGNDLVVGDIAAVTRTPEGNDTYIAHDQETGHDDVINAGDGDNFVLAGLGSDTVTSGTGVDYILADNGEIYFENGALTTAFTTQQTLGGNDVVNAGDGDNTVLAGAGSDTVTSGEGHDRIISDIGQITQTSETLDVVASLQTTVLDNDTVNAGNGDNIIITGLGHDSVTSGEGNDRILLDSGEFHRTADQTTMFSTDELNGGNDSVDAGDGDNWIIGGLGSDTITSGQGNDQVLADIGTITETSDELTLIASEQPVPAEVTALAVSNLGHTADDQLNLGDGDNNAIAGLGDDQLVSGNGRDVVHADNGDIIYQQGQLKQMYTTQHPNGGDDVINAGDGDNLVMGGMGNDQITTGAGRDTVFGDTAVANYTDGVELLAENQPEGNSNDQIETGAGNDIAIGGLGDDRISGGDDQDLLIGDLAIVEGEGDYNDLDLRFVNDLQPEEGGADLIKGDAGSDIIIGGKGSDDLRGGDGNDLLSGDGALVRMLGYLVDEFATDNAFIGDRDWIEGNAGNDVLLGGDGFDTFVGSMSEDVMVFEYGKVAFDTEFGLGEDMTLVAVDRYGPGRLDLAGREEYQLYANGFSPSDNFRPGAPIIPVDIVEMKVKPVRVDPIEEETEDTSNASVTENEAIIRELNALPATAAGQPINIDGVLYLVDPETGKLIPYEGELLEEVPTEETQDEAQEPVEDESDSAFDVDESEVASALLALGSWKVLANAVSTPNQGSKTGRMTKQQRISAKVNNWLAMQKVDCEALDQDAQKRSFIRWEDGQLVSNDALKKKIG